MIEVLKLEVREVVEVLLHELVVHACVEHRHLEVEAPHAVLVIRRQRVQIYLRLALNELRDEVRGARFISLGRAGLTLLRAG